MAIIKIKTIKNNLEKVINYAQNGDKTENGILVSGVNCVPKTAYQQMALTKKFYHQEKGRQGEDLYRKLHKATTLPEKNEIERQIRLKTYEINRTSEGLKVCRRFMWRRNLLQREDVKNRKQQLAIMEFKPKDIVKDLAR